jgi:hypothetical protein
VQLKLQLPRRLATRGHHVCLGAIDPSGIHTVSLFFILLGVLYIDGTYSGEINGNSGDVEFECRNNEDFADASGSLLWIQVNELPERVETDHAQDDRYSSKREHRYDAELFAEWHLQSPESRDRKNKDVEIENDVLESVFRITVLHIGI